MLEDDFTVVNETVTDIRKVYGVLDQDLTWLTERLNQLYRDAYAHGREFEAKQHPVITY